MTNRVSKAVAAGALISGMLAAGAGVAGADHGHYVKRTDKDGQTHCQYVADGQTSKSSDEPGGHKFHDNVHTGQPGTDDKGNGFNKESNEGECDTVRGKR